MRRAILACIALLALAPASAQGGALPATFDGAQWHNHFEGEAPLSDPSVLRYTELAMADWKAKGRPMCRPDVLVAPDLDGALGAAEPRSKGSYGCTLWVSEAEAHPDPTSLREQARICHVIRHEVGHLAELDHTDEGIMAPGYSGAGLWRDVDGREHASGLCGRWAEKAIRRHQALTATARGSRVHPMNRKTPPQPKVRSKVAQDAFLRGGAGTHGGGKRPRNRRDRQATKRALRAGSES